MLFFCNKEMAILASSKQRSHFRECVSGGKGAFKWSRARFLPPISLISIVETILTIRRVSYPGNLGFIQREVDKVLED